MVQHNRIELLNHPVCKEYLLMKWWVPAILPKTMLPLTLFKAFSFILLQLYFVVLDIIIL